MHLIPLKQDAGCFGKHQRDERVSFNRNYKQEKVLVLVLVCVCVCVTDWVYTRVHVAL